MHLVQVALGFLVLGVGRLIAARLEQAVAGVLEELADGEDGGELTE